MAKKMNQLYSFKLPAQVLPVWTDAARPGMSFDSATDEIDSMLQGLRIDARAIREHIDALTEELHTAAGNKAVVEMKIEHLSALQAKIHTTRQQNPGVQAEEARAVEERGAAAPLVPTEVSRRRIHPVIFWSVGAISVALLVVALIVPEQPVGVMVQAASTSIHHTGVTTAASSIGVPVQLASTTNTTPVTAVPIAPTPAATATATVASQPSATSSVPNSDTFNADEAVAAATRSFQLAVQKLSAAGGSCEPAEIAQILDLQKIEFASGSEQIPSSAQDNLRVSTQLLKICVEKGHPIRLQVAAFSDSGGSQEANLHLSHKRAVAVRAHLVEAGVPEHLLTAKGYGEERPVASNDTTSGRFANRRIEFIAVSR